MPGELSKSINILHHQIDELRAAILYHALGPERIFDFAVRDTPLRMYLPNASTDYLQRLILLSASLYELDALEKVKNYIKPGSTVVDVGANIGNHTLFFGILCGAGQIYAFEPLRTVFDVLERNIALNGLANVTCHNAMLGAREGLGSLENFDPRNIGGSTFQLGRGAGYRVTTLDALRLDRLDFLKIDVEGNQVPVIEGARATIERCRPTIWIELRASEGEYEPGDLAMQALGYHQIQALSDVDFLYAAA